MKLRARSLAVFAALTLVMLIPTPAGAHEVTYPADRVAHWEAHYRANYPSAPQRDVECAAMREVVFEDSGWRWPSNWKLYCHVTLGSDSAGERRCVTSPWYKFVACDWNKIKTLYGPDYKPLLHYLMGHELLGHVWAVENCAEWSCGTGDVECFADQRAHLEASGDHKLSRYYDRCMAAGWPD